MDISLPGMSSRVNHVSCAIAAARSATPRCSTASSTRGPHRIRQCRPRSAAPPAQERARSKALGSANFPVGMFAEAEYQSTRVNLEPGDFLVIYTDGVSEATNCAANCSRTPVCAKSSRSFSGKKVDELAETIREGVQTFTGGAPQSDDITLLVDPVQGERRMKRKPASEKGRAASPLHPPRRMMARIQSRSGAGATRCADLPPWCPQAGSAARVCGASSNGHSRYLAAERQNCLPRCRTHARVSPSGKHPARTVKPDVDLSGPRRAPLGVLEAWPKDGLDAKASSWLELFRRYAEVALVSSERRNAVIELSTMVEATKRLNSTLDLAELIDIILHLATRYTGRRTRHRFSLGPRAR